MLVVILLAGAALASGCDSDGAGSIHIESPKARKEAMKTGAGVAPTPTIKPSSFGTPRESNSRAAIKNRIKKKS
jgi:hypothetical protein